MQQNIVLAVQAITNGVTAGLEKLTHSQSAFFYQFSAIYCKGMVFKQ